jgi:diketogulonate reductase-like aldo/keto reductase
MARSPIPQVSLPDGRAVPALGLGTWRMGERPEARRAEVAAIRAALEAGTTLIDTAEMYAEGGAESVVGEAIAGLHDRAFVVSKVLPSNASPAGTVAACERSLERLGLERIDLYLLHWRGRWKLADTVDAFERLVAQGKIGGWGVSNFDVDDLDALAALPAGARCATNQIYYALSQRGPEFELLPRMAALGMPAMAYSPLDEGRLVQHPALRPIAAELGASCAQVALAWLLAAGVRAPGVIAIPKSGSVERVLDNAGAAALVLEPRHLAALDRAFAPPRRKAPLAMI